MVVQPEELKATLPENTRLEVLCVIQSEVLKKVFLVVCDK